MFTSTLGDALAYAPSDCFRNFPFLAENKPFEAVAFEAVERVAREYHDWRAYVMTSGGFGATEAYNRFHNAPDRSLDIQRLRDLHHELDLAVLRAYGWEDLAARAAPEFLTEETEPDHRYQGRLFWPAPFRDEVLARLLDLNRARAEEERLLGLSPRGGAMEEEEAREDAEDLI